MQDLFSRCIFVCFLADGPENEFIVIEVVYVVFTLFLCNNGPYFLAHVIKEHGNEFY